MKQSAAGSQRDRDTTAPSISGALRYVLVTPARNEEAFIERTIQSVIRQTKPPLRWIIVSDGSTDATDDIVRSYARDHPWIDLLRLEGGTGRSFARKALAFNEAYAKLGDVPYDIVGNLDADISFDEELFCFLLDRFAETPDLGVAGIPAIEEGVRYDYRFTDIHHVSGACQLFRKACLEELGGYVPLEGGGIDWLAVTTARMNGWKTKSFVEHEYVHHRKMGSAERRPWGIWFRRGQQDYDFGGHPLWQLARGVYQSTSRPYVIGSVALLSGYAYQSLTRAPRPISRALLEFQRAEQMRRLKGAAARLLAPGARRRIEASSGDVSIDESLQRLESWVEAHDYRGYEPFDGLSSYLRPLTFGNRRLEQVLQQAVRRSPVNLRPLLGITPLESTKGRGYMARGYLARLRQTGLEEYRTKAIDCLEWLIRNRSPHDREYSWGNHFDYASRAGRYSKHESIIVWTSLIGQAFLDGYEQLRDVRHLDVAKGICDWIMRLPREKTASGTCLSYLANRQLSIHNANLLGAAFLARTARQTGAGELFDVARSAVEYSCSRQLPNGGWYYGEEPRYRWIDNFHTGYDLDAIKCYIESSGDDTFRSHLDRGLRYFKSAFIGSSGEPRYYHDRTYPIDIQCAAQTIETLAQFAEDDPEALPTAVKVARWTIRNMQDPGGYFYYRRTPVFVVRIPMLHWGQATMYRALALLLSKLESGERSVAKQPAHD